MYLSVSVIIIIIVKTNIGHGITMSQKGMEMKKSERGNGSNLFLEAFENNEIETI